MGDLLTEINGPVARMTFNRPEVRNALTPAMLLDMEAFLLVTEADPTVRCLIMAGAGKHFMAGGDLTRFAAALEQAPAERLADFSARAECVIPVFDAMEKFSKPIIAQVRGAAAGAAIGWVAAADFVLASDTALFVFAHIGIGLCPDGALSYYLPRVVGARKAKELVLLGDRLDAGQALSAGLVNWVVADAELDAETERLTRRIAAIPAIALTQSKRLLDGSPLCGRAEQMKAEALALGICASSNDFVEGVRAFGEKRKPVFSGR